MVHTWDIAIPELTGEETRKAYIYLPASYDYSGDKRYPVLYMFDGHNVFFDSHATYGKSWGMMEYMDSTQTEMIIAAVECNHSPKNGRLEEYSPFSFRDSEFGFVKGRGKLTMDWMSGPFKAYIDEHYRTLGDREHTFIAGSSMGGLMSLYALLEYNSVYSRAAALSPSVALVLQPAERMIRNAKPAADTVLYMDYGELEMGRRDNIRRCFSRTAELLMMKRILLDCRVVPGGTHCEASWERQIPFFMNTLLYRP